MPTSDWCDDGPRIESPVSLPNPTSPKLAAIGRRRAAARPGRHPVQRVGILRVTGQNRTDRLHGLNAHSAMLDFASTIAPAAFTRSPESRLRSADSPANASAPSEVCSPLVSKLSLTIIGTQCSGPVRPDWAKRRSSSSASLSASGLIDHDGVDRRPVLVVSCDAPEVLATSPAHVSRPSRIASWTWRWWPLPLRRTAVWTTTGGAVGNEGAAGREAAQPQVSSRRWGRSPDYFMLFGLPHQLEPSVS